MTRTKTKGGIRDLSRVWPTKEEIALVLDMLGNNVPPLVTAILGAALVEHDLVDQI